MIYNRFDKFAQAIIHFLIVLGVPILTIVIELQIPTGSLPELLLIQGIVLLHEYIGFLWEHPKLGKRLTLENYISIVCTMILLLGSIYFYMVSFRIDMIQPIKYSTMEYILPMLLIVPIFCECIEVVAVMIDDFKNRTSDSSGDNSKKRRVKKNKRVISKVAGCV